MKDLSKLFGQGLLSLQVLHGSVRRAGQRLQQAAQGVLCKHIWASEMCLHVILLLLLLLLYRLLSPHVQTAVILTNLPRI